MKTSLPSHSGIAGAPSRTFLHAFGAASLIALSLFLSGCLTDDKGDEANGPTITVSPSDQLVSAGSMATFTVVASGTGSLTYQWMRDGDDIAGATSASYSFTAGSNDDGAEFKCKVTDASGSTTSSGAFLRIAVLSRNVTLGAQGNLTTASSLDLDTWTTYSANTAASHSGEIDLVFAYSTAQDSAALYSPQVAKNGVAGSSGFDFMQDWPSANSTDIRVVHVDDWNSVTTAAAIQNLYTNGTTPSPAGRVFVRTGMTVVARSNSNLYVLILVNTLIQGENGAASFTGKAKW